MSSDLHWTCASAMACLLWMIVCDWSLEGSAETGRQVGGGLACVCVCLCSSGCVCIVFDGSESESKIMVRMKRMKSMCSYVRGRRKEEEELRN